MHLRRHVRGCWPGRLAQPVTGGGAGAAGEARDRLVARRRGGACRRRGRGEGAEPGALRTGRVRNVGRHLPEAGGPGRAKDGQYTSGSGSSIGAFGDERMMRANPPPPLLPPRSVGGLIALSPLILWRSHYNRKGGGGAPLQPSWGAPPYNRSRQCLFTRASDYLLN